MTVIVKHLPETGQPDQPESWWMADVIFVEGGARNPKVPTIFQVADVDSGAVRWVNADLVTHIVPRIDQSLKRRDLGGGSAQRNGDH